MASKLTDMLIGAVAAGALFFAGAAAADAGAPAASGAKAVALTVPSPGHFLVLYEDGTVSRCFEGDVESRRAGMCWRVPLTQEDVTRPRDLRLSEASEP